MEFEYYSLLEISRDANPDEIKKAYRKKAMELHPDRHGGDKEKEKQFKKLNEAYETLSDSQKKAHYDRFGSMDGHGQSGFGGFQGGFESGDLGDIFSSFFGGGFSSGWARGRRRDIWEDIEVSLSISFEEALRWGTRDISYEKSSDCHHCNGKWGITETCHTCHGTGQIREQVRTVFGIMEQSRVCHTCHGTGQKIVTKCEVCHGKKKMGSKVEKTIDIPLGIENGMSVKMRWEGHTGHDGNGDLYISFRVPESENGLVREGADIHYTVSISPAEAVLGVARLIEIPIIGKKPLDVSAGTQSGTTHTFRDEWFTRLDRRGVRWNLVLHIEVEIPKKITSDQKRLYEAILQSEWGKTKKGWLEDLFWG